LLILTIFHVLNLAAQSDVVIFPSKFLSLRDKKMDKEKLVWFSWLLIYRKLRAIEQEMWNRATLRQVIQPGS